LNNIHEKINNYCDANLIPSKVKTKINQIFELDFGVATGIINGIHFRFVLNSDASLIVKSFSTFYERKTGIKPIEKEFISFLSKKWFAVHSSKEIKKLLCEFMVKEEIEFNNYFQDAKNIFQQTLGTIPPQILSIEQHTSATVEESKKVGIIDFVKDIKPCAEFDNLFGNDIKGKIEIWNYMIDLKMIDSNGVFSMGSRRSFIRSFVLIMKKYFKIPNQSDTKLIEIFTLKLLGKSKRINESVKADEQQIEDFLNGN
jgi:hypothetical protein